MEYKDHRNLNKRNEDDRRYLTDLIKSYKELAVEELNRTGYADICHKIALYCEGKMVPVGISDDSVKEFLKNNLQTIDLRKFQVKKDENNIIFFSDNRIGEIERGYIAEFTRSKKTLRAEHDKNPKNNKLETAVGRYVENWESRKRIWKQVRQPAIRYMLRYNRAYTRLHYDPWRIKGFDDMGDISMKPYHPLSVLTDPYPERKFTLNSRFIIPFEKVPIDQARLMFQVMGIDPERIKPDNEADEIMFRVYTDNRGNTRDEFVTIYYPEWKQYALDSQSMGFISRDESGQFIDNKLSALNAYCYWGIYHSEYGMIHWDRNKYTDPRDEGEWQFMTIPYEDEQSDLTVLGTSRIGKLLVIQDMLNVVLTLKLNSERHRMIIRGFINKLVSDAWGPDLLKDFMNKGALAPLDLESLGLPRETDIRSMIHFLEMPDTSSSLAELLVIIDNVIKRQTIRKEVLQGQLPTKTSEQMSGKLARELKDSNATLLQPIVQNIEWSAETEARLIYRMLSEEFGEDEWVEVQGGDKNNPKYIPIEAHWRSKKFYTYLKTAYPALGPEEAARKFDEQNMVEIERVWRDQSTGQLLTPQEVEERDIYHINSLKDQDGNIQRFAFKVGMIFDAEDTKYEDKVMAAQLFSRNPQSMVLFEIFLEQQGGYWADNKDSILEKYKTESEAIKRLEYIQSLGPEFWQSFLQFAQQWQVMQKIKTGQIKPEELGNKFDINPLQGSNNSMALAGMVRQNTAEPVDQ